MNKTELHERYITSVRKLADAFVEVTANWDDEALEDIAPYTAYPFELDLSELTLMVLQWSDAWEETKTSDILEIHSAAKPNEEWLHQSAIDYILNPEYEYGVWTPRAEVICFDCHNEIHTPKFNKGIAKALEENHLTTFCGNCGKLIQVRDEIASEHNLVLALKKVGLDASMAQTGGMCSAVNVNLRKGNNYLLKESDIEDENTFLWAISEYDKDGEWIEDSNVADMGFSSIEEVVTYLSTNDKVSKVGSPDINDMLTRRLMRGSLNGFVSMPSQQWIVNPFVDETMMNEVDPVDYYGEHNIQIALSPPQDGKTNAENDPDFHLHPHWQETEEVAPLGHLETLQALKLAFAEHIDSFLTNFDMTDEYSDRFDIGITLGDKTFRIPLCAELSHNFEKMIQAEIDDLN